MMSEKDASELITDLTRETAAGKLKWRKIKPPGSIAALSDATVDYTYLANFERWHISVTAIGVKDYLETIDEWYIDNRIVIALLSSEYKVEFILPTVSNSGDLLRAIQHQSADVTGFLQAWRGRPKG